MAVEAQNADSLKEKENASESGLSIAGKYLLYAVFFIFVGFFVWLIGNEQATNKTYYQTVDGLHTKCTVTVDSPTFGASQYMLECPDGYIQHNGAYMKMKQEN